MDAFLTTIGSTLTAVIGWLGSVFSAMTSTDGDLAMLLPLLAIGIVVSIVMLGARVIRSFTWGA